MQNSEYFRDQVVDLLLNSEDLTISLHTGDPGTSAANELRDYGRQPVTFVKIRAGTITNQNILEFNQLPGAFITHFGVWRSDNFCFGGVIVIPKDVPKGESARWLDGELVIRIG